MKQVKSGETIIVTDRKKEIAVIMPFEKATKEEKIFRLIQRGMASWSGSKPSGMISRIASRGKSVSGLTTFSCQLSACFGFSLYSALDRIYPS